MASGDLGVRRLDMETMLENIAGRLREHRLSDAAAPLPTAAASRSVGGAQPRVGAGCSATCETAAHRHIGGRRGGLGLC